MQEMDFKLLWQDYSQRLDYYLALNQQQAITITQLKIKSSLSGLRWSKWAALLLGCFWVLFVDTLVINLWSVASPFFLISAILQSCLTKLAIGIYLYQLVVINQVKLDGAILSTQQRLAELVVSTLWVARILFLQIPLWTTFYLHGALFTAEHTLWLVVQALITLVSAGFALWLFINFKVSNKDKRWFRLILDGPEWTPLITAMDWLDELKAYKHS